MVAVGCEPDGVDKVLLVRRVLPGLPLPGLPLLGDMVGSTTIDTGLLEAFNCLVGASYKVGVVNISIWAWQPHPLTHCVFLVLWLI